MTQTIMPTYARQPITFEKGRGVWLWDDKGKRYFDALSGISVCNLGHSHPRVSETIARQADQLIHTSNIYQIKLQQQLADKLTQLSGLQNAFFCNSGAEANEAAIKIARRYGHSIGVDNPCIITMQNSFHGRTLSTLSATGNPAIQDGFQPLVPGFMHVPFNDLNAVQKLASENKNIVAILVEPVQGEGGIQIPDTDYLEGLRKICDTQKWLLMLDEVQTGMGRTGKFFAFSHTQIKPDVVTLAKALGNGLPIGACLAANKAAEMLTAGKHGSTFGGNPLACASALTVIEVIESEGICANVLERGMQLRAGLNNLKEHFKQIKAIRTHGLMIGIELHDDCPDLVKLAIDNGLLINVTKGNVIRLLPPLIVEEQHIEYLIEQLSMLLAKYTESKPV